MIGALLGGLERSLRTGNVFAGHVRDDAQAVGPGEVAARCDRRFDQGVELIVVSFLECLHELFGKVVELRSRNRNRRPFLVLVLRWPRWKPNRTADFGGPLAGLRVGLILNGRGRQPHRRVGVPIVGSERTGFEDRMGAASKVAAFAEVCADRGGHRRPD